MAEGEIDLEKEYLPDGGFRLQSNVMEDGIQKIKRELSEAEKEIQDELEGKSPEKEELPREPEGFQVASGGLFSHHNDPVLSITKNRMCFSRSCVEHMPDAEYVELLFNPVERMIAVRTCSPDHPNAIAWKKGFPSTAFSKILFEMLGWNPICRYLVLSSFRKKDGEKVALFDLEKCIVRVPPAPKLKTTETEEKSEKASTKTQAGGKIIFYGADDEPKTEEKRQEDEERQRRIEEIKRRTFGSPFFEYEGKFFFDPIDSEGEWDISAEAVEMDSDYHIDDDTILNLQIEMSNEVGDEEEES